MLLHFAFSLFCCLVGIALYFWIQEGPQVSVRPKLDESLNWKGQEIILPDAGNAVLPHPL